MQESLGIVALDNNIQFSSICLEKGDMEMVTSSSTKSIHTITTDFEEVGVFGAVDVMCS